jgi:hypothetical protein
VLAGGILERDPFWGGRFTVGYYLDDCAEKAVELSGFFLGPRSANFRASSFEYQVLARPFFAANTNEEAVQLVSFPQEACGQVSIKAPSQLWGLEPNFICKLCCDCTWRIDALAGFRYLNLREALTIEETVIFDSSVEGVDDLGHPLAGSTIFVKDRFVCQNQFYGGQLGAEARWQRDRWTVDGRVKVALGVTQHQLQVEGFQVVSHPGGAREGFVGGLLALPSNIGNFERDVFSVVPEVSVSVGYYLTDRLRAMLGYNFLYWSHVVRPGDQIDRALDIKQIPNFLGGLDPALIPNVSPPRPAVLFKSTDFWAQGITFGLEYRY